MLVAKTPLVCKLSLIAVVTREIKLFQNYFSCRRRPSEIILILARGNLPEIISKLFHRLIAAHEYFPTCSVSLKKIQNNFRTFFSSRRV